MKKMIQYAVVAVCLLLIGWYFYRHQHELDALRHLELIDLAQLSTMFVALNLIVAVRLFWMLCELKIKDLGFISWIRIYIVSRFISFYLTQGANVYRSVKLKQGYDFSYTNSLGMIMFLAWLEFVVYLAIAIGFVAVLGKGAGEDRGAVLLMLIAALIFLIAGPFGAKAIFRRIKTTNAKLLWLTEKVGELTTTIVRQIKNAPLMLTFCLLSVLTFVLTVEIIRESFSALHAPVSVVNAYLYTVILMTSRNVSVIPGNIGLSELLCGYFANALGYSVGSGIIVSSLFRLIDFAVVAVIGLPVQLLTSKRETAP